MSDTYDVNGYEIEAESASEAWTIYRAAAVTHESYTGLPPSGYDFIDANRATMQGMIDDFVRTVHAPSYTSEVQSFPDQRDDSNTSLARNGRAQSVTYTQTPSKRQSDGGWTCVMILLGIAATILGLSACMLIDKIMSGV